MHFSDIPADPRRDVTNVEAIFLAVIKILFKALLNAYKIEETNKRMLQKVPRELCQQLQAQEMKVRRMPR